MAQKQQPSKVFTDEVAEIVKSYDSDMRIYICDGNIEVRKDFPRGKIGQIMTGQSYQTLTVVSIRPPYGLGSLSTLGEAYNELEKRINNILSPS